MAKNTYKTITVEDLNKGIQELKKIVIEKYKAKYDIATLKLREVAKEREESRNVMHDIGLENKMSILKAEREAIDFCIKTLRQEQK